MSMSIRINQTLSSELRTSLHLRRVKDSEGEHLLGAYITYLWRCRSRARTHWRGVFPSRSSKRPCPPHLARESCSREGAGSWRHPPLHLHRHLLRCCCQQGARCEGPRAALGRRWTAPARPPDQQGCIAPPEPPQSPRVAVWCRWRWPGPWWPHHLSAVQEREREREQNKVSSLQQLVRNESKARERDENNCKLTCFSGSSQMWLMCEICQRVEVRTFVWLLLEGLHGRHVIEPLPLPLRAGLHLQQRHES